MKKLAIGLAAIALGVAGMANAQTWNYTNGGGLSETPLPYPQQWEQTYPTYSQNGNHVVLQPQAWSSNIPDPAYQPTMWHQQIYAPDGRMIVDRRTYMIPIPNVGRRYYHTPYEVNGAIHGITPCGTCNFK